MQGSYRDTMEKFPGKKGDNQNRKANKADRQFRDRRRNRHQDA